VARRAAAGAAKPRQSIPPSWTALPDALIEREARLLQAAGGAADPLAGLVVRDDAVDRLVGGDATSARREDLVAAFAPVVDDARAAFVAVLDENDAFAEIVRNAHLSVEEAEVLALCCAVELEPRRQRLVGYLQDDVTQRRPTLHLLSRLFGANHAGPMTVARDGRLRCAALVDVADDRPWADRGVQVPESVIWTLLGDSSFDPALPMDVDVLSAPEDEAGGHELVFAVGDDAVRRLQAAVTAAAGTTFLAVDAPTEDAAWRAVVREATMAGIGVVIRVDHDLPPLARHWIERADHLVWAVTSPVELPLDSLPRRPWVEVRAEPPRVSPLEWELVFGSFDQGGHQLTAHQLRKAAIAREALGEPHAAIRRLASGPLERLARRVRPRVAWDDIVLPPRQLSQLRELSDRYLNRSVVHGEWGLAEFPSPGLVAMFSGVSGTGKTTAAEIIAGDLELDMFKIDLSTVVSKYIGETEKNLEEIFQAAAAGNLVLLFDEADALFGKRSEVSDARDRYANVEVAYLLQRLETFEGLVIMTTNLQNNIDQAFMRRVHVTVDFPLPDPEDRKRIWERVLAGAPTEDIDLDFLSRRFELPGGSIRNAALTGAFLAASAGTKVDMESLVLGLKRELQKLGRLTTESDFGAYYHLVKDGH
jgi:AAA+ superfamily predicted ATPase